MATKGASNRYGNTRGGKKRKSKTIAFQWAKDFNKNTLQKHFDEHGEQMGCSTKESYAAHAVSFANAIDKKNCVSYIDENKSTYKYNKKTNTLAIITKDGYVVTYYKPKDGYKYYKRGLENEKQK